MPDPAAAAPETSVAGTFVYGGSDAHIWVVNGDGTSRRKLTAAAGGTDFDPHWSPDGTEVVFRSTRYRAPDSTGTGYDGIYVVNVATGAERMISPAGGGLFPNWSPHGNIIFSSPRSDGTEGLFSAAPDGSNMTDLSLYAEGVEWSPDGRLVALNREDPGRDQNWEVWRANANFADLTRLTASPADDYLGAWSPDAKRLAFQSHRGGDGAVWLMDADASNQRALVDWPGAQSPVTWLPDGRILFVDNAPGLPPRYFVVRDDPLRFERVPALTGIDAPLDWRPN